MDTRTKESVNYTDVLQFDLHHLMVNNKVGDTKSRYYLENAETEYCMMFSIFDELSHYCSITIYTTLKTSHTRVYQQWIIRGKFLMDLSMPQTLVWFHKLKTICFLRKNKNIYTTLNLAVCTQIWYHITSPLSHNKSICKHIILFSLLYMHSLFIFVLSLFFFLGIWHLLEISSNQPIYIYENPAPVFYLHVLQTCETQHWFVRWLCA